MRLSINPKFRTFHHEEFSRRYSHEKIRDHFSASDVEHWAENWWDWLRWWKLFGLMVLHDEKEPPCFGLFKLELPSSIKTPNMKNGSINSTNIFKFPSYRTDRSPQNVENSNRTNSNTSTVTHNHEWMNGKLFPWTELSSAQISHRHLRGAKVSQARAM